MQTWNFENKKQIWDFIEWFPILNIKKYKKKIKINLSFTKAPFVSVYESYIYITKKDKYFDDNRSKLVEIEERKDTKIPLEIFMKESYPNLKFIGKNIEFLNN